MWGHFIYSMLPPPPVVKGVSVIVVDAHTGGVFYERNADEKRPVGSTQKLLTSLLVAEHGNLEKDVVIEPEKSIPEPDGCIGWSW